MHLRVAAAALMTGDAAEANRAIRAAHAAFCAPPLGTLSEEDLKCLAENFGPADMSKEIRQMVDRAAKENNAGAAAAAR